MGVADLGAIDVERGRDHGMPFYNELRQAYGLAPERPSPTSQARQPTASLAIPRSTAKDPIDDPDILDFVRLERQRRQRDRVGSDEAGEDAVVGVRRTTLAARLKAIYGNVDQVDAFVGMLAEPHVPGRSRAAATRDLEAAVRGAPGRGSLLLRQRSASDPDRAGLRDHVQAHARGVDQAERGRDCGGRRVQRARRGGALGGAARIEPGTGSRRPGCQACGQPSGATPAS